jgi:hypothetical protein
MVPNPIPVLDGLLAATALAHDLTLVTRNTKDVVRTGVKLLDPFQLNTLTLLGGEDIRARIAAPDLLEVTEVEPAEPACSPLTSAQLDAAIRQAFGQQVGDRSAETNNAESGFET